MSQSFHINLEIKNPEPPKRFDMTEQFYEAGLDDTVIGIGNPDVFGFDIDREGDNAYEVLESVMNDIRKVLPDPEIVRVHFND